MSDLKKFFGSNLKKIRKSKNITQEKLAELIDLHYRQMSKIETGENFPSSKTIEKICYALNISPAKLFDFELPCANEITLTGTDNSPYYKAVKQGGVVILEDFKGKKIKHKEITESDSETNFTNIAKNLNKPITVEYFEKEKKIKTLIYNPDGTITSAENNLIEKEFTDLVNLIKEKKSNPNYVNFIKIATQSLDNDMALKQLESIIDGIKIAKGLI